MACVCKCSTSALTTTNRKLNMMQAYCAEHGLRRASDSHREIYLSDARKTDPARLKTVLRFGVEPVPENSSLNNKSRFPPENEKEAAFLHGKSEQGFDRAKSFAGKRGAQAVPAGLGKGKGKHGGAPPFSRKFPLPDFYSPIFAFKHPSPRQCPPGSCLRPEPDRGVRRRNRRWARQLP